MNINSKTQLKNNKEMGPDKIFAEMLKKGKKKLCKY